MASFGAHLDGERRQQRDRERRRQPRHAADEHADAASRRACRRSARTRRSSRASGRARRGLPASTKARHGSRTRNISWNTSDDRGCDADGHRAGDQRAARRPRRCARRSGSSSRKMCEEEVDGRRNAERQPVADQPAANAKHSDERERRAARGSRPGGTAGSPRRATAQHRARHDDERRAQDEQAEDARHEPGRREPLDALLLEPVHVPRAGQDRRADREPDCRPRRRRRARTAARRVQRRGSSATAVGSAARAA